MDAAEFALKWRGSAGRESAGAQEHFIDLCSLVGEPTPNQADPSQSFYTFEKATQRASGPRGQVDVWLKDKFALEYKGKHKDLQAAYKQCLDYHEALGNPPLLVVCDLERFEVHTKFTNRESWVYHFDLLDLMGNSQVTVETAAGETPPDAPSLKVLDLLKALWADPSRLRPEQTTEEITRGAAGMFDRVADDLRKWARTKPNYKASRDDRRIAHFVSQMVFCMFASDIGLLPRGAFSRLLETHARQGKRFRERLAALFREMQTGGDYGADVIPHINGDLFTDDDVPDDLTTDTILILQQLDALNWADVEPAIFGTLFERVLDERSRAKLGAHYTSRPDIETLVEPVLMAPLRREWEGVREAADEARDQARLHGATEETQRERVRERVAPFLDRLAKVTVLDPACGSGNFLYVSLALLKGLEKEAIAYAALQGVYLEPRVHPRQLLGIETNEYAHELASMVIWIGYLQWKHRNGIALDNEEPILQKLNAIRLMDAIVEKRGTRDAGRGTRDSIPRPREPEWPEADVIVGNPPFLGGKLLRRELGDAYVDDMFEVWADRVPHAADLCCYWHEKARQMVADGKVWRAGLLATQGIRGGKNREVLKRIKKSGDIFFAESDRKWYLDGAAVRTSMIGFDDGSETRRFLDQRPVEGINANLTSGIDLTQALRLAENRGVSFQGDIKQGPFDIDGSLAQRMLVAPNPDGRSNTEVVRPWANGDDIAGRPRGMWIIDFGVEMPIGEAELYEEPFKHVATHVRPFREEARSSPKARELWWIHAAPRPAMRHALASVSRFIMTPRVSKHRLFVWEKAPTLPDSATVAFAREDDYFFGVLHSRAHELWALRQGTQLEDRPRYTPTTCFETFPLPWAPGSEPEGSALVEAIAEAARRLDELREGWLNPEGPLVGEEELRKRTLTNLYNERPAWLNTAHRDLDEAVFNAYGWPPDLSDDEVLARLLALNLDRARAERERR